MRQSWIFLLFLRVKFAQISLFDRFQKVLKRAENVAIPRDFEPIAGSERHQNTSTAVFSVGIISHMMPKYYKIFLGTLRKTGFDGDIVLAVDITTSQSILELCSTYRAIIYEPQLECKIPNDSSIHRECRIFGTFDPMVPLCMTRYRLYQWWAKQYNHGTQILITDFRDVFFQSNPFLYNPNQWSPPVAELTVFLEAIPQKAIYRCLFNSGWIRSCYGEQALNIVKTNPVSCSGTSLGSRDGILIYVSL